jgi:hypothetical protein
VLKNLAEAFQIAGNCVEELVRKGRVNVVLSIHSQSDNMSLTTAHKSSLNLITVALSPQSFWMLRRQMAKTINLKHILLTVTTVVAWVRHSTLEDKEVLGLTYVFKPM